MKEGLTCNQPDTEDNDELCDQEYTATLYQYMADNIVISDSEANKVCEDVKGACTKDWSWDSCPDNVKTVIYKHLGDVDVDERFVEEIEKLKGWYKAMFPKLSDSKFHDDIVELVETFAETSRKIDAELLCNAASSMSLKA